VSPYLTRRFMSDHQKRKAAADLARAKDESAIAARRNAAGPEGRQPDGEAVAPNSRKIKSSNSTNGRKGPRRHSQD